MKKNKRGLGAEKVKKEKDKSKDVQNHSDKKDKVWCIRETHSVSKFLMCIYIELFEMGCFKFLKFKSFDLLKRKNTTAKYVENLSLKLKWRNYQMVAFIYFCS